jgi:hypothetical protein
MPRVSGSGAHCLPSRVSASHIALARCLSARSAALSGLTAGIRVWLCVFSGDLQVINEIAEMKSCNNCVFFEARKRQDLYMWVSKTPSGPSVKFLVQNVHTMDELRLTGNAMMGSRPLLSFDAAFETVPHLQLIKEMFTDVFGTPRGHPKSKPFIDRVMAFCVADNRIWVRNYQIMDKGDMGRRETQVGRHLTSAPRHMCQDVEQDVEPFLLTARSHGLAPTA